MNKPLTIIIAATCAMTMTNCKSKVSPGQDFYQYACGDWMKANPIPDEYSRFGSFEVLGELNRQQLQDLITGIDRATAEKGSNAQKIADLYYLGMDSASLNQQGSAPLQADLAAINSLSKDSITSAMATMPGLSAFFGSYVTADMKNAAMNAMYISQGGLNLGDRDYYLKDDEDVKKVRDAYANYLIRLAELSGYSQEDAKRLADNTLSIEKRLAAASMDRVSLRNDELQYNPARMTDLKKKYPNVDLATYFKDGGIAEIDTVIVCQPEFMAAVDSIIQETPIEVIRDYVASGYLTSAANYLSDEFVDAAFEFNKVLSGVQKQQPRWKRSMEVPNGILGEALGELYVEKYFPQSSKDKMLGLVGDLKVALGQHIDNLTWMSDETKAKAHEKLDAFTVKIGYPDQWRDYSALTINPELSYWDNIKAAEIFNRDYNYSDFGKPVDKTRWFMSPQTVNAYYNPATNEICFPAGILQKPFFDPNADDAVNYGAIGVVIGHEMTHGFDDQGSHYDKDGNLADWWTPEDKEAFTALTEGLAEQFDQVIVLGDTHANGHFTNGENIADQGGLRVAHTAYHNHLGNSEGEVIDGITPDQRFYLAYANVWANNIRDEEILRRTKMDPHSLGRNRVNVTLRNLEPFFQAFSIKEGDPMYRPVEERVVIW